MVLRSAPENLAAIRALADIHHRIGEPIDPAALQEAAEAESAAQTIAVPEPALPVLTAAPAPPIPAEPLPPPAPAPLKLVAPPADSHPSIALVTRADEVDAEELETADLTPTMADAQLPVIHQLEQLLAGIERARHSLGA